MDQRQLGQVARFVNAYPSVEVAYEIEDEASLTAGVPITLKVSLTKEPEDEDDPASAPPVAGATVVAPFFPGVKQESWWLVVEDPAAKKLLGLKKVTASTALPTKIEFTIPAPGKHELKLDLICECVTLFHPLHAAVADDRRTALMSGSIGNSRSRSRSPRASRATKMILTRTWRMGKRECTCRAACIAKRSPSVPS